ncbi:MAG TPA: metallophosphoesterase [Parvularculaceae bacterium]|nr:metallophosphoesterase [Amphiplicatus sp.]HPE31202.1 metallophosphoesterase [Parvularculaceae bacterium]
MPEYTGLEYFKLAVFYASYLYFPAAALLIWAIARRAGFFRWACVIAFCGLSALAYARFIEPRILLTVEHDIELKRCFAGAGEVRLAVFSDTHQGLFGNVMPIDRIVRRVNASNPDAVLIAGDLTSMLHPEKFDKTFAALGDLSAPAFAVLGNHDGHRKAPAYLKALSDALGEYGVDVIDNERVTEKIGGAEIEFAGLSDWRVARPNRSVIAPETENPRFLLVHNPKAVFRLPANPHVDLFIAGHTHGGQIYLPGLTCWLVRFACAVDRYGFAGLGKVEAFVTSGTGMSGLPLRFNMPPRIDMLNVRYKACSKE